MEIHNLSLDEIKFAGAREGEFLGYASVFDSPIQHAAFGADVIRPGAYANSLRQKGIRNIKLLWQHNDKEPIGKWTAITEDSHGLHVRGELLLDLQKAREARTLLRNGVVDGLSIGFSVPVGGATYDAKKQTRTLNEIDLFEVSLVTFPADVKARILEAKSQHAGLATLLRDLRTVRGLLREPLFMPRFRR